MNDYLLSIKLSKLSLMELEYMTVGMVLEYVELYAVTMNPKLKEPKEATQVDIQRFKGR